MLAIMRKNDMKYRCQSPWFRPAESLSKILVNSGTNERQIRKSRNELSRNNRINLNNSRYRGPKRQIRTSQNPTINSTKFLFQKIELTWITQSKLMFSKPEAVTTRSLLPPPPGELTRFNITIYLDGLNY